MPPLTQCREDSDASSDSEQASPEPKAAARLSAAAKDCTPAARPQVLSPRNFQSMMLEPPVFHADLAYAPAFAPSYLARPQPLY